MGELWFVGAGLSDEQDLSRRALALLRRCSRVFAEEYTAVLATGSLDRLALQIGRPVELLDRASVESGASVLAALAGSAVVALVVPGDPFAATTHVALRNEVERAGHSWHYLPNATIISAAAGFLGLQPYRFGRTVSIPFPSEHFAPTSPLERISENRSRGLHTLVLLDLRPDERRFMTAREALGILTDRDPDGVRLPLGTRLAVVARVGSESARGWVGDRAELAQRDFGPPLHALVVLAAELHEEEAHAIRRYERPEGAGG